MSRYQDHVMDFTNQEIMELKPGSRAKRFLTKYGGLYLNLSPSGRRTWRWDSRSAGGAGTLTLGAWPEVDFEGAKILRDLYDAGLKKHLSLEDIREVLNALEAETFIDILQQSETGEHKIIVSTRDIHHYWKEWENLSSEQLDDVFAQELKVLKQRLAYLAFTLAALKYKKKFCKHD